MNKIKCKKKIKILIYCGFIKFLVRGIIYELIEEYI